MDMHYAQNIMDSLTSNMQVELKNAIHGGEAEEVFNFWERTNKLFVPHKYRQYIYVKTMG